MSIHRFDAKRDISEPGIVRVLEAAGYSVTRLSKPADLAVRKAWYPRGAQLVLKCKTPQGKAGTLRIDKRQLEQNAFIDAGGAIRVGTPEQALAAMNAFELWITP